MPYDKIRAEEPIQFIECLKLPDDFYGQPFVLQDWQKEIIRDVYGTINKNGFRQYKFAYLEIPKKNGKTTLIAGLGLSHLTCDPPGGQIYCCAADREQATLVYKAAKDMIEQDEVLSSLLKVVDSKKEIHNRQTGTVFKVLSAEAYTKHGINPTVVIFDELHAQPNRGLWDVMTKGAGAARKEPLWWIITTAGDDPDRKTIGWEIHEKACKIRDGKIKLSNWYVKIYGAPENADIWDEKVWFACNPSLGTTINIDGFREEAEEAKYSAADEKTFRWLRLNQWNKNKRTGWLPLTAWDATEGTWTREDLRGCYCFGGLDLATTWDLNAHVSLFPPQRDFTDWRFIMEAWIPEDNMNERVKRDGVAYDQWARDGYIKTTPGNVTDYSIIRIDISALNSKFPMKELGYDQYNATETAQFLSENITMVPVAQTILGMSPAMKQLEVLFKQSENLVKEGKPPLITHEHHPAGRWCFGNVSISMDGKENYMPIKDSRTNRIDIFVALVDAMARALLHLGEKKSVYESRGMRSLAN